MAIVLSKLSYFYTRQIGMDQFFSTLEMVAEEYALGGSAIDIESIYIYRERETCRRPHVSV